MDLPRVLRELHEELSNLDAAIASLERLQEIGKRRLRREPWLAQIRSAPPPPTPRGRPRKPRPPAAGQ